MGPDLNQKPSAASETAESVLLVNVPNIASSNKQYETETTNIVVEDIKIRKGQWINKGQIMFILKPSDITTENSDAPKAKGSMSFRMRSEASGKVLEVCIKKGEQTKAGENLARISLAPCPHSTLMKNMCADCGADLEHIESQHLGNNFDIFKSFDLYGRGLVFAEEGY